MSASQDAADMDLLERVYHQKEEEAGSVLKERESLFKERDAAVVRIQALQEAAEGMSRRLVELELEMDALGRAIASIRRRR